MYRCIARCLFVVCSLLSMAISQIGTLSAQAEEAPPKTPFVQLVEIVVAKDASPLEQLAAKELAAYIDQLSEAEVEMRAEPGERGHLILLGNPATNPAIKRLVGDRWPDLSYQGIYLKSIPPKVPKGRDILIVGGGSPIATLWAVHELAERWGVVHLLSGDNFPDEKQMLVLSGFDYQTEPVLPVRTWRLLGEGPESNVSWSMVEQQKLLAQLARLKFNRVQLVIHPEQPFLDYSLGEIKKQTAELWLGESLPVDGETPGRDAFGGAEIFQNPDLPNEGSYDERIAAGRKYIQGIVETAQAQGMSVEISVSPLAFPLEFAPALKGVTLQRSDKHLEVTLDLIKVTAELASVQLIAAHKLCQTVDSITYRFRKSLTENDNELLHSKALRETLPPETKRVVFPPRWLEKKHIEVVLSDSHGGVLAQLNMESLPELLVQLAKQELSDDFEVLFQAGVLGELDIAAIFISRASFDPMLTPQELSTQVFSTLTGQPDSAERTWKALVAIDELTQLAESEELNDLVRPDADLFKRIYKPEPLPDSFEKMVKANGTTTTELYRARSNCLKRGSNVLYYYAKRGEYVGFYLSAVKALREAAAAKEAGDMDLALEKLEVALEAVNDSLSTYGDVAQDPSDRGLIALLAARLYRPLMAEYEQMLDAAESRQ